VGIGVGVVSATVSPASASGTAVTAFQVVTLVIAVLGLVVSVVALTWQVVQHRLTGSRVRVELLAGALGKGGAGTGPIEAFDQEMLARQGLHQPIIAVRALNVGRLPVDVTGWDVKTGDGFGYTLPGWGPNPSLPYRLEPGAQVTFFCPMADVLAMVAAKEAIGKDDRHLQAAVALGTGETVASTFGLLPRSVDPLP